MSKVLNHMETNSHLLWNLLGLKQRDKTLHVDFCRKRKCHLLWSAAFLCISNGKGRWIHAQGKITLSEMFLLSCQKGSSLKGKSLPVRRKFFPPKMNRLLEGPCVQ